MQFFIVHPDPKTNGEKLPDYAIKQVNVREGWQILSDICHNLGVPFDGRNKAYSIWHAETRRFMVNRKSLINFLDCYYYCLEEYTKRFGKTTVFHERYYRLRESDTLRKIINAVPEDRTQEEFMREYMLRAKGAKITESEKERLS